MRKLAIAIVTVSMLLVTVPSSVAQEPSVSDAIRIYTKYNNLRDRLLACQLDKVWHNLSSEGRANCRALSRYYVLYTAYGESSDYQVHCIHRRHCLATPARSPSASGPIPAGAHIYRY
jgi:hypothetical protein